MTLSRHAVRAAVGAVEVARSWAALRGVTRVGSGVQVFGWPRINNDGALVIGSDVALVSTPSAIELVVARGGTLEIGDRVLIESGSSLRARGLVRIGRGVRIGAGCIVDGDGPVSSEVSIGDGAWLEDGAVLLGGAVVPAGSVVAGRTVAASARAATSPAAGLSDAAIAEAERRVRKVLSRVVPATTDVESSIELTKVTGWDSLAALRVLVALEKEFAVMLPIDLFAESPSAASVTHVVAASVAKHTSHRP